MDTERCRLSLVINMTIQHCPPSRPCDSCSSYRQNILTSPKTPKVSSNYSISSKFRILSSTFIPRGSFLLFQRFMNCKAICISYLLPCDKLPLYLVTLNNTKSFITSLASVSDRASESIVCLCSMMSGASVGRPFQLTVKAGSILRLCSRTCVACSCWLGAYLGLSARTHTLTSLY